jgi:hypothetical protein
VVAAFPLVLTVMAAFAVRALGAACVQSRPGTGVLGLVPASLNFGVAVTACGLLVAAL